MSGLSAATLKLYVKTLGCDAQSFEIEVYDGSWHQVKIIGQSFNNHWSFVEIDLSSYAMVEDFKLRFSRLSSDYDNFYVDKLEVSAIRPNDPHAATLIILR